MESRSQSTTISQSRWRRDGRACASCGGVCDGGGDGVCGGHPCASCVSLAWGLTAIPLSLQWWIFLFLGPRFSKPFLRIARGWMIWKSCESS